MTGRGDSPITQAPVMAGSSILFFVSIPCTITLYHPYFLTRTVPCPEGGNHASGSSRRGDRLNDYVTGKRYSHRMGTGNSTIDIFSKKLFILKIF